MAVPPPAAEAKLSESVPIGIVASRYNHEIVEKLVKGAHEGLMAAGVDDKDIHLLWVPGALEIPAVASVLIRRGKIKAIIGLGCVIRGDTYHFDIVADESARGLGQLAVSAHIPVMNGILTCETVAQAEARAGGEFGNKGSECALGAIEMISAMERARTL